MTFLVVVARYQRRPFCGECCDDATRTMVNRRDLNTQSHETLTEMMCRTGPVAPQWGLCSSAMEGAEKKHGPLPPPIPRQAVIVDFHRWFSDCP